jgi:hypothetical protein
MVAVSAARCAVKGRMIRMPMPLYGRGFGAPWAGRAARRVRIRMRRVRNKLRTPKKVR